MSDQTDPPTLASEIAILAKQAKAVEQSRTELATRAQAELATLTEAITVLRGSSSAAPGPAPVSTGSLLSRVWPVAVVIAALTLGWTFWRSPSPTPTPTPTPTPAPAPAPKPEPKPTGLEAVGHEYGVALGAAHAAALEKAVADLRAGKPFDDITKAQQAAFQLGRTKAWSDRFGTPLNALLPETGEPSASQREAYAEALQQIAKGVRRVR